jgi:hypothetical protein
MTNFLRFRPGEVFAQPKYDASKMNARAKQMRHQRALVFEVMPKIDPSTPAPPQNLSKDHYTIALSTQP